MQHALRPTLTKAAQINWCFPFNWWWQQDCKPVCVLIGMILASEKHKMHNYIFMLTKIEKWYSFIFPFLVVSSTAPHLAFSGGRLHNGASVYELDVNLWANQNQSLPSNRNNCLTPIWAGVWFLFFKYNVRRIWGENKENKLKFKIQHSIEKKNKRSKGGYFTIYQDTSLSSQCFFNHKTIPL